MLKRYRQALIDSRRRLTKIADALGIVAIFQNAATDRPHSPSTCAKLIDAIDGLHWYSEPSAMRSATPMKASFRKWRRKPSVGRGSISRLVC